MVIQNLVKKNNTGRFPSVTYLTLLLFLSSSLFGSGVNTPVVRSVDESIYDPKSRITITENNGVYTYTDEFGNLLGTSYDGFSSNPIDIETNNTIDAVQFQSTFSASDVGRVILGLQDKPLRGVYSGVNYIITGVTSSGLIAYISTGVETNAVNMAGYGIYWTWQIDPPPFYDQLDLQKQIEVIVGHTMPNGYFAGQGFYDVTGISQNGLFVYSDTKVFTYYNDTAYPHGGNKFTLDLPNVPNNFETNQEVDQKIYLASQILMESNEIDHGYPYRLELGAILSTNVRVRYSNDHYFSQVTPAEGFPTDGTFSVRFTNPQIHSHNIPSAWRSNSENFEFIGLNFVNFSLGKNLTADDGSATNIYGSFNFQSNTSWDIQPNVLPPQWWDFTYSDGINPPTLTTSLFAHYEVVFRASRIDSTASRLDTRHFYFATKFTYIPDQTLLVVK